MSTITAPQAFAPIFRIREHMRDLPASALPVVDAIETELDQLAAIIVWALASAHVKSPMEHAPEAIVMEHPVSAGDWTIFLPALGKFLGKYGTSIDAQRAARRSGYNYQPKSALI